VFHPPLMLNESTTVIAWLSRPKQTSQKQEKEEMIKYYFLLSTDDYTIFIGGYKLLDSS